MNVPVPVIVVALGDSTTAGTPLFTSPLEAPPDGRGDERSQFTYWLMRRHRDWRVVNRGVNGDRTDQIAARFDRDVMSVGPRAVIVIAGVNDIYQGRPARVVTAGLASIYARAAAAHLPVVAGSIVPYNTASAAQNAIMHEVNHWIADEAARLGHVVFADTRRAAAAADDPDRLAGSPDGLHPDIEGYRRMAEMIAPALEAALALQRRITK